MIKPPNIYKSNSLASFKTHNYRFGSLNQKEKDRLAIVKQIVNLLKNTTIGEDHYEVYNEACKELKYLSDLPRIRHEQVIAEVRGRDGMIESYRREEAVIQLDKELDDLLEKKFQLHIKGPISNKNIMDFDIESLFKEDNNGND